MWTQERRIGHHSRMEIVVDYDTVDGPPLVRYECSDAPGSWRYVANSERIVGIPASIPYARVIEAMFANAVPSYEYSKGEDAASEFDYWRDYEAAVDFAEKIPIEKFGRRDFYIKIYVNGRGVSWCTTTIQIYIDSDRKNTIYGLPIL